MPPSFQKDSHDDSDDRCNLCGERDVEPLAWSPIHRRCRVCGLVWLPNEHREDPQRLYTTTFYEGERFNETSGISGYPSSYANPQRSHRNCAYQRFAKQLCSDSLAEDCRVLDFGCGYGLFLQHVKAHAPRAELVGVEVDALVAKRATQLSGCQVVTALPDMRFDRIALLDVLEHVGDPRATLRRLFALARPGARLLLTTPNIDSWNARFFKNRWNLLNPPEHITYFKPTTLSRLLSETGWEIIDIHTEGHPLHNERGVSESWRGRLARRVFSGPLQDNVLNRRLRVGPVLVAQAARTLH